MDKNDEKFIKKLFSMSLENSSEKCPSEEDMATLVDGVLEEENKNKIMKHIAKCSRCYEVYTTIRDLTGKERFKRPKVFGPFSIAASIFIAAISLVIFYKLNVREQVDPANNISESTAIVGEPLPARDKDLLVKRVKDNETEVPGIVKEKHRVSAPAPEKKEGSRKEMANKQNPDDKKSIVSGKIFDEDISAGREIEEKKKEKFRLKSARLPLSKSDKVEEEVPGEGVVLRSVLSKNEIRAYSRQGRGKDSNIKPGIIVTTGGKKGKSGKRREVPEIKKMIHLPDPGEYSDGYTGEKIRVEFEIKKDGTIKKIYVLSGGEGRVPQIKKALSGWIFSPSMMEHLRFTIDLFLNEKGKFKVLK